MEVICYSYSAEQHCCWDNDNQTAPIVSALHYHHHHHPLSSSHSPASPYSPQQQHHHDLIGYPCQMRLAPNRRVGCLISLSHYESMRIIMIPAHEGCRKENGFQISREWGASLCVEGCGCLSCLRSLCCGCCCLYSVSSLVINCYYCYSNYSPSSSCLYSHQLHSHHLNHSHSPHSPSFPKTPSMSYMYHTLTHLHLRPIQWKQTNEVFRSRTPESTSPTSQTPSQT